MKKLLFLLAALGAQLDAGAAYRCVDEKGVTHIGDTPPVGCANVPMYEISKSGRVLRKIDPTPTADEVKVREAEAARSKEEAKVAAEQRRKDMALLNSFSTEKEFDVARDRNVEPVRGRIANAQERAKAVDKRLAELEDEMEFYRAGKSKAAKSAKGKDGKDGKEAREAPPQLLADVERARAEKATLARNVAGYEKEIQEIRTKFDDDKKRWLALKSNPGLLKADAAPSTSTTMLPATWSRGTAKCGDKTITCRRGESFLCLKADSTWHSVPCEAPKL